MGSYSEMIFQLLSMNQEMDRELILSVHIRGACFANSFVYVRVVKPPLISKA